MPRFGSRMKRTHLEGVMKIRVISILGAAFLLGCGAAQMVRVCNGKDLPKGDASKTYLLRSFGNLAHEIWDVSVPEKPSRLAVVVDKLKGTHKNWWECDTGIAYLVSGLPDWRTRR